MDNRTIKGKRYGLCFRCEHRAQYFETGHAPRMECGSPEICVGGCYMYKPVKPVVVEQQNPNDPRPIFGPALIAGRVQYKRLASDDEVQLKLVSPSKGEYFLTWIDNKEE